MKALCIIFLFFASTSAISFNCQYKEVSWLAMGMNYQCQTEALNVGASQYVTSVYGNHTPNKTIDDVVAIHIQNCTNLSYIPKGLLDFFPNLVGIYLDGCSISSLSGTELNEHPKLTLFALEFSPLNYVPGNLFAQTPDMVLISFAENKINGAGRNLLSNLNKLSQAYFELNVCVNKNGNTTEEIIDLIDTLNSDCTGSVASGMFNSISLILILSCFAYLGTQNLIN